MKKIKLSFIISLIMTMTLFVGSVNAYYTDSTNQYYRLNTGETIILTYTSTAQTNNFGLYSTDLKYDFSVKNASAVQTVNLTNQTINTQNASLDTNYQVTIKNNSAAQYLYVNVSYFGIANFTVTTTSQGNFAYNGEGGGSMTQGSQSGTTTINPGDLKFTLANSTFTFPNVTLNGSIQTISTSLPTVDIIDATGTGNGWQLSVNASPFTEVTPAGGFASGTTAKAFSTELYNLQPTSIIGVGGSDLTGVTASGTRQSILNTDAIIASATKGYGTGEYQVTFNTSALQLQIFNNKAYIDFKNYPTGATPYQSTLTWKINVAP